MGASRCEEYFEDNKVIVDTPPQETNKNMKLYEWGNRAIGAADHGLEVQSWTSKIETMAIPASVNNVVSSGEQHMKVENMETKTPSESEEISEIEPAAAALADDNTSNRRSVQFQPIFRLVSDCDECSQKIYQCIVSSKNENTDGDGEMLQDIEPGLAESVKAQHGHSKEPWKLLREARLSNKGHNNNYWNDLLQKDGIFKLKNPLGDTLLHVAAEKGDEQFVKKIVRGAADLLTVKNLNGDTALHVAAKAGHFSVLKKLIAAHFKNSENCHIAMEKILEKNNEGNGFFHEALINGHDGVMDFLVSHGGNLKKVAKGAALSLTSYEKKSGVCLAIEYGYKDVVGLALTEVIPKDLNYVPEGKSLLLAAIIKRDEDILDTLLTGKPEWIHLTDTEGRVPLHYAASIGYLKGVKYLLKKCSSCVMERDIHGFLPIHLASYSGQVAVVQELLKSEFCPDTREILDNGGRNILHLAVQSGKHNVVKYILHAANSNHELGNMINEHDCNGNTPLHLATMYCHPKIVHALTWDRRVGLALVNRKGQTALDVFENSENPTLRQRLTWTALKSAGVRSVEPKSLAIKVPPKSTYNFLQQEAPTMDHYKDRISTLMLVSTLIITVTFAAGFTIPGGLNNSGSQEGMAVMLHHIWFKIFIFCITISMYGAISVTIILIWAQLGDITLALLALEVVSPLLGITLATLSLAFLAGIHLVIKSLSWLATTSLAMGFIFIFMLLLLYTMLWFPSSTSKLVIRYISYYPFLLLASLVEPDED